MEILRQISDKFDELNNLLEISEVTQEYFINEQQEINLKNILELLENTLSGLKISTNSKIINEHMDKEMKKQYLRDKILHKILFKPYWEIETIIRHYDDNKLSELSDLLDNSCSDNSCLDN
ncbi:putative ORFan [Cotonvirus japonicus]|uniref:ORFan n=1 Tax=Cotonvirus japonicus TaxID=2811091 RepID=A0ABM7NSD1_9VIRU|nr:putative ORFan [Cotonvirus japonicus]BCS83007.1 putative ORFan [Cotonvirus japonicus]